MAKTIWTMVAAEHANGHYVSFTMIDNNYMLEEWDIKSAVQHLRSTDCEVTNLGVNSKGEISASNGAMDKYTRFDAETRALIGKPGNVILNRIERNNKLVGYTVFTAGGTVKKLSVSDAVKMYSTAGIANGKIRHIANGDIISSINGEYPIMEIDIEKAQEKAKLKTDVIYLCDVIAGKTKVADYAGVLISGNSANSVVALVKRAMESNKGALAAMRKLEVESLEKSMETLRLSAAKYFVVMSTAELDEFKANGVDVSGNKGKTMVSRLIFKKPGEYTELRAASMDEANKKRESMRKDGLSADEVEDFIKTAADKLGKYTK